MAIGRSCQPIVHPLAFAPGQHQACAAQVGEMPGDFGLGNVQDVNEVAHANLASMHQLQEAQAGEIREGAKNLLEIGAFSRHGTRAV